MGVYRPLKNGGGYVEDDHPDGFAWLVLVVFAFVCGWALQVVVQPHPAISIAAGLGVLIGSYVLLQKLPPGLRFWLMGALTGVPAGAGTWSLTEGDWIWTIFIGVGVGVFVGVNFLTLGEENFAGPPTDEQLEQARREIEADEAAGR